MRLLRAWDGEDPAPGEPPVTLTYSEGRFAGRSGCNSYTGSVEAARMACAELHMQVESRYLENLQAVTMFGVTDGDLALTYQDEAGASRVMLFSPPENSRP